MSEQVAKEVEAGSNGSGSIPEVSVKIKQGKGAKGAGLDVSNPEALDALAEFGGDGGAIRVERVAPATHEGRRVQLGDLNLALTVDDLKDPGRLHGLLGPRGRAFLIKVGKKAVRFTPVGHDLSLLDYEPDEQKAQTHTIVYGPNGLPVAVPTTAQPGFPQASIPGLPFSGAGPWGMYPQAMGPDAIAKAVAEAVRDAKKDDAAAKALLDIEQKRLDREEKKAEREEKERREERERRDRDEKERRDREERDRKEAREREEKRAEREEKDRKEKEEKERKEKADRDERERKDREERDRRWLEDQKEARAERARAHELEMKRIDESARVQLEVAKQQADAAREAAKIQAQSQKEFFEMRLKELEKSQGEAPDPLEMLERVQKIALGPRTAVGEVLKEVPTLVEALGREFSRVKSTPPALPAPAAAQAANPLTTLTRDEMFSAFRTLVDGARSKYAVEQVLPLMRRAKVLKADGTMDAASSGTPNMVAFFRARSPEEIMAEIMAAGQHATATDAEKAVIAELAALGQTEAGKAWLGAFLAAVKA